MKFNEALQEKKFELNIGDKILTGRFKNREEEIEEFDVDDKGQPVVITNKKERKVFPFRIEKYMEKEEKEGDKT